MEKIEKAFNALKMNFNNDKILMLITDGSYIELLNAYNIKDTEI